jgi:methyl-accepting chemotaxis protein
MKGLLMNRLAIKIALTSLISIFVISCVLAGIFLSYNHLFDNSINTIKSSFSSLLIYKEMKLNIGSFKFQKDYKYAGLIKSNAEEIRKLLLIMEPELINGGEIEIIKEFRETKSKIAEIIDNTTALLKERNEFPFLKISSDSKEIEPRLIKLYGYYEKNSGTRINSLRLYLIGGGVLSILIIILFMLNLIRSIIGPIKKITAASLTNLKGELGRKIEIDSNDEIGSLANAFNSLSSLLAEIIIKTGEISEAVSKHAFANTSASKELNSSASNISNSIQGMARGTFIQIKQLEKTAKTAEQSMENFHKLSAMIRLQSEKIIFADDVSKTGKEATKEAILKMSKIIETVEHLSATVKQLKDRSTQIEQIMETITKIAEQTNLLAINTSIEAARVGEGAREFRMIADEVRKLAEASGRGSEKIVKILKAISNDTNNLISAAELETKVVADGVSSLNNTAQIIEKLSRIISELGDNSSSIGAGITGQTASCEKLSKDMDAMSSITEENAHNSEDVLKLSEKQNDLAKKISESSRELTRLSNILSEIAGQFKAAK